MTGARGFRESAAAVIAALGPGEVASYGEIAVRAGYPGAARAVGALLSTTHDLPWWRVVRSDGTLVSSSPSRQAELLRSEGIAIREHRIADPALRRRLRPDISGGPLDARGDKRRVTP